MAYQFLDIVYDKYPLDELKELIDKIDNDKRMLLLPIRSNYKEANQKLSERTF